MKPSTDFLSAFDSEIVYRTEKDTHLHYVFKFDGKYGASLYWESYNIPMPDGSSVNIGSYGRENGLWELAVIKWGADQDYSVTYETDIAPDDVLGYLDERTVLRVLKKIKKLSA